MLFFDEADALFGKRSEVRDAHDRYANIEIVYLLQRMEEQTGQHLGDEPEQNMDAAFMRRLACVVEFPLPDEASVRRSGGELAFGNAVADDADLDHLADQFKLSGDTSTISRSPRRSWRRPRNRRKCGRSIWRARRVGNWTRPGDRL